MFKIMTIPFNRKVKGFDDETLNRFVLNKEIKTWHAEFFHDREDTYWTVFIEYETVVNGSVDKASMALDEPQRLLLDRF